MTIDERLDRLTERHEALTQTVGLMAATFRESHDRLSKDIAALAAASQQDAGNIRALARIAEIHEQRLSRLEGE